ncbi:hypothetical protein MSAN_00800100 [Mycena sanguinolenta]|uniref:Uncharacterized protein n=1 Tax=Mycena sanguinolenta TaxID=230812 RepID=A0A8H7DDA9_9AGAR|nr:hypothetical protein MSAN_00800100 [Mycena sanguinolenta]
MAPKPRPVPRKPSISKPANPNPTSASTSTIKSEHDAAKAMPPPPPPAGVLVPEVLALATCLKNAVVKTGQLYAFYADTRKLGIQQYAPAPPQSLTAALGREVEKYDQLCDSIESQLASRIHISCAYNNDDERDLAREERRIKQAEAEAEAKANSVAGRTRSASRSPTTARIPLPPIDPTDVQPPAADPALSPQASSLIGRRPSAISISSLQRPNLPLKLDLSSSALRITPEEAASLFSQGLSSPVTLAPRSARPFGPGELPPEIIAALASASSAPSAGPSDGQSQGQRVDIDLTSPDRTMPSDVEMAGLGNSADKPIELDLDAMEIDMAMSDLFGDGDGGSNAGDAGLFTPVGIKQEEDASSFLSALGGGGDDMFGGAGGSGVGDAPPSTPNALLASFSQQMGGDLSQQMGVGGDLSQQMGAQPDASHSNDGGNYDLSALDLTNLGAGFFADSQHDADADMGMGMFDMEQLLGTNIGGDGHGGNAGADATTTATTGTEAPMDPRVKTEHYVPGFGV